MRWLDAHLLSAVVFEQPFEDSEYRVAWPAAVHGVAKSMGCK